MDSLGFRCVHCPYTQYTYTVWDERIESPEKRKFFNLNPGEKVKKIGREYFWPDLLCEVCHNEREKKKREGLTCKNCNSYPMDVDFCFTCYCNWKTKVGCGKCFKELKKEEKKHQETCQKYRKIHDKETERERERPEWKRKCLNCQENTADEGGFCGEDCLEKYNHRKEKVCADCSQILKSETAYSKDNNWYCPNCFSKYYIPDKPNEEEIPSNLRKVSYKHLECKDWETNKKRVRDEAEYSNDNGWSSRVKYYDKDKNLIIEATNTNDIIYSFDRCKECGKQVEHQRNCYGDEFVTKGHKIENDEVIHLGKNSPKNKQSQTYLPILISIWQFFTANNVHTITEQNGNLVINFNTNTNNTPPPQVIEKTQLSEKDSTMEVEQKTMWQKFKDYLKQTGKNKVDKQYLEQEIKKLETQENQKPTSKTPLIIGGSIIGGLLLIGVIALAVRKNKKRK